MLVGDDHGVHADRHAVLIAQGHLALGIGFQHRLVAGMAQLGQPFEDLVGIEQGRRHHFRGLVGGIAEHDALVAGAFLLVGALALDAHGDFRRLAVDMVFHRHVLPVEAVLLIADAPDHVAGDLVHLVEGDLGAIGGAHLAGQHHAIGRGQGLHGDLGARVARKEKVDNRVGDLVGHLVGVAL